MRFRFGMRHAFLCLAVVAMMIGLGIFSMPGAVFPGASARGSGSLSARLASAPVPSPLAVSSNVVVVTTTADVVNGAVSSVAALNANPGADGISLREALQAADATGGSATVYIMFSAALNGATIEVLSELPPITPRPRRARGGRSGRVAGEGHARRTGVRRRRCPSCCM